MNRIRVTAVAIVAVLALVVVSAAMPAAAASKTGSLSVKITNTGVQWGKVKISSINKTCSKPSCSYKVKVGTKLSLKETATSTSTWPFCGWKVNGKSQGKKNPLSLKMASKDTVSAVYGDGSCSSE